MLVNIITIAMLILSNILYKIKIGLIMLLLIYDDKIIMPIMTLHITIEIKTVEVLFPCASSLSL